MEALFAEGFPAFITADQTMTGTAQEWERWAGMPLPASGRYVIPQGPPALTRLSSVEEPT